MVISMADKAVAKVDFTADVAVVKVNTPEDVVMTKVIFTAI